MGFGRRLISIIIMMLLAATFASCSGKHTPRIAKPEAKEKDDPYFQFIRADLLAMKGETQKSTAELLKLTKRYPRMAFFYLLLAHNYGQEHRLQEAVNACKEAVEVSPGFAEARIYLGKLYASQEMHSEAVRTLADVVRDFPKEEDVYPLLASEHVIMREYGRAVEVLKQMISFDPDALIAYFYLGQIYEEHLGKSEMALQMYREALSIDPGNVGVQSAIAESYLRHKQLGKALDKYQDILHEAPDEIAVALRIALIHYELKEYDEAIAMFVDILKKNADADKIRFYLGVLYESTKDPDKAIVELSQVPANSSYFKDARLHIASMDRSAGRVDEAAAALRDGIEKKGQIPEFYEYLAAIYEENRDYKQAIAVLEEGHKALPGDEKMVFLLAIICEKARDRDRAVAAMRDVLKINPKNASALNYIGYTYAEKGENLSEALEMVQQALVLKPDDGYITDSLGWVYVRQGDLEHGLKYLLRANSLVPGETTILYHLGEALYGRGEMKGALKYYEQALDAGAKKPETDEEELEKIKKRIEELKK
ncbi:MAG: tetratricopeptide repeat protein [Pseudomonadota bacterium]